MFLQFILLKMILFTILFKFVLTSSIFWAKVGFQKKSTLLTFVHESVVLLNEAGLQGQYHKITNTLFLLALPD